MDLIFLPGKNYKLSTFIRERSSVIAYANFWLAFRKKMRSILSHRKITISQRNPTNNKNSVKTRSSSSSSLINDQDITLISHLQQRVSGCPLLQKLSFSPPFQVVLIKVSDCWNMDSVGTDENGPELCHTTLPT